MGVGFDGDPSATPRCLDDSFPRGYCIITWNFIVIGSPRCTIKSFGVTWRVEGFFLSTNAAFIHESVGNPECGGEKSILFFHEILCSYLRLDNLGYGRCRRSAVAYRGHQLGSQRRGPMIRPFPYQNLLLSLLLSIDSRDKARKWAKWAIHHMPVICACPHSETFNRK